MKVVFFEGGLPVSASDTLVAVILTDADKVNIASMHPEATIYAAFPDTFPADIVNGWLDRLKADEASS